LLEHFMRVSSLRVVLTLLFASVFPSTQFMSAQANASPDAAATTQQGEAASTPLRHIGGGVSAPVATHTVEPNYSAEAREQASKQNLDGLVIVNLIVDQHGLPQNVHVLRGMGMGLDEKAVEAVKKYRFKPAMEGGKPVSVELNVQVRFQSFETTEQMNQALHPSASAPAASVAQAVDASSKFAAVATGESAPGGSGPHPAYADDPKFQKALAHAKEPRQPVDERLSRWKNANKIAKGQCVDCLHQIIVYQLQQSQWKDAVNTATQLDAIATDAKEKFYAEAERGVALMHSNDDEPKPEQLKEAEASMRSAFAIAPKNANLVYMEGRALAMMGRDDEARQMFQSYLDLVKMSDPYRTRAEHFLENPRLAALRMAPAFTLTTSEGEQISLDDMGGKVVLLDFWATWCGPCKESLPDIQRVAKKFADQPLVVVSISSDRDENAWKTFVAKNNMTWRQYRDANGSLQRAYGVDSIPRYFTIDTDGALQSVKVGSGADIEGDIRKLLKKAADVEKKKARESEHPAAGE
jgi:TonB family protein